MPSTQQDLENEAKKLQEGILDIVPSLKLDVSDEELVKTVNQMLTESAALFEQMKQVGDENERYWKGAQLEDEKARRGSLKIVDNRIFLSSETIIPIATSRTPEPTIRTKDGVLREKIKQILMNLWEVPNSDDMTESMQANFELLVRHWMIYRIGVLKYYYDEELDEMVTEVVRPSRMRFDRSGKTLDGNRFVAEYKNDTVKGLIEKWPSKKQEILAAVGQVGESSNVVYVEFWTNEWCVYKFLNVILEKKKNPNFDYGDMGGKGVKYNLFKKPRKPFIVLNALSLGKTVYDDTSLFEQSKTLQDGINRAKRNIADNAADNGVLCGSGDFMDKKVLEAYSGAPDEKIFIKNGSARDALQRLEPKQMAPYINQDLQDTKSEIDNIFGTHSTTRGEKSTQETAQGRQILKSGDMGRIDLISRSLDRVAQEWYKAMLHMLLVYKTEPYEINSNDEEGTSIIFNRNEYINQETQEVYKIIIKVKEGSSMSIDKDARREEATDLFKNKLIDPITFFARMDYPNPQEMAKKLFLWLTEPIKLFPDLAAAAEQQQQQAAEAGQNQMLQDQQVAANNPLPPGTPINLPSNLTAPAGQ